MRIHRIIDNLIMLYYYTMSINILVQKLSRSKQTLEFLFCNGPADRSGPLFGVETNASSLSMDGWNICVGIVI
jgi:hypothetical protein